MALDVQWEDMSGASPWFVGQSQDDIVSTQGTFPTNTLKDEKDIRSAWVGVTRIVSKRALMRFGRSYTYRAGGLCRHPVSAKCWPVRSHLRCTAPGLGFQVRPATRRLCYAGSGATVALLKPTKESLDWLEQLELAWLAVDSKLHCHGWLAR